MFNFQSGFWAANQTSDDAHTPQPDDTQIILGSVVRIVSLTDDDSSRNESMFKYRLVNSQNISARRLPDVLLIGVKKCGTRALLEFTRVHPDGETRNRYYSNDIQIFTYFSHLSNVMHINQFALPEMRFTFSIDTIRSA